MNDTKWVSMWGNAMSIAEHHPEGYAKDLTLRYPVYAPFSGSALRFTLDNYCGKEPVTIHRATVAVCDSDLTGKVPLSCPLTAGTIRDITFDGSHSVTLAAGASATSDALSFPVSAGQTLCVSLYFNGYTAMQSAVLITGPLSRGYFSYGDQTHSEALPLATSKATNWFYFLSNIDILTKEVTENCNGIEGLKVIEPAVFGDARGYFMETYNYNDFAEAGIDCQFVQDNQSASKKGVLRGLHFQINYPQDKLVRVVNGEVFDVAVDLREGSKTFGKWYGVLLSAENKKQFFVPKNFAHGFIVLSEEAEFCYKVTDFYHPNDEGGILWNDAEVGVEWPMPEGMTAADLILSDKDKVQKSFAEYKAAHGIK